MRNALPVFARWLHAVALSVWLGGLLAIGAIVAPTAFHVLASYGSGPAGAVVGDSLRRFNFLCYGCGAVLLVANGLLWPGLSRAGRRWTAWAAFCAVVLLGAALYQGFGLFPIMDAARVRGDKALFDTLHLRYEHLSIRLQFPLLLLLALFAALRDAAQYATPQEVPVTRTAN